MSQYQTIKATPDAANALRRVALDASARAGRRISLSDTLSAVCAVASRDLAAVLAALPEPPDGTE